MDRNIRRLLNTKQDNMPSNINPSISSMIDGQISISQRIGESVSLIVKKGGRLWKTYLSHDGNQYVDKNLTIGNLLSSKDLKLSGSTVLGVASTVTTATHQDAYDVTGKTIIPIDTSSNDVRFGGFANGVKGQVIYIVQIAIGNNVILEHNESSGTQKIKLPESGDYNWDDYGGWTFYCDGSSWYPITPNFN
jgi:hypothetical protein